MPATLSEPYQQFAILSLSMIHPATEPILVVIAHPIAGNPTQFAVERALRSMNLEWRVLSFEVQPENVAAALDGFAVTGITGVLIDPSLQKAVSDWYRSKVETETDSETKICPIDCLHRDEDNQFIGIDQQREWLNEQINAQKADPDEASDPDQALGRIWFGESLDGTSVDADRFPSLPEASPADPEIIENTTLIAVTNGQNGPVELGEQEWPENDGSTLVIDLSDRSMKGVSGNGDEIKGGHPGLETIEDLGYRVISVCDRKIGTLQRCLSLWTQSDVSSDVIRDAIEEYLGV